MDNNLSNQNIDTDTRIAAGDWVVLADKKLNHETQVRAKVLEVREVLGKQTYVIETEDGKRKVVGGSQISRADSEETA